MNISYLKHSEISKLKWDKCISLSFNGIVYAYSWYLDIVSHEWDALVMDDYKAVMPITTKSNLTYSKIVQPEFASQLGVFTSERLDVDMVNSFLSAIPAHIQVKRLCLNSYNKVTHPKFQAKYCIAYELDLIEPYKALYLKFTNEAKEAIKKSKVQKVNIMKHVNLKELLLLKKNNSHNAFTFEQLNFLRRIIPFCSNHNIGESFGAYNNKNELVAGTFFIKSHQKVSCLLAACNEQGKMAGADYALFNHYIKERSEKNITLDFGDYYTKNKEHIGNTFGGTTVNFYKLKRKRFSWLFNYVVRARKLVIKH